MKKGLALLVCVLLVIAKTAFAGSPATADISSVARETDASEAANVWATIDTGRSAGFRTQGVVEELPLPQAPGAITVSGIPNGSRSKTVQFSVPGTVTGYVTARMVYPTGDIVQFRTWFLEKPVADTTYGMLLWDGWLPHSGRTLFQVFNVDSGRVSRISAAVSIDFCCGTFGPSIGAITPTPDGKVFIAGNFSSPTVAVGGYPAKNLSVSSSLVVSQLPFSLNEGEWTLTVCDKGECATRDFYYGNFPPVPPSVGGRG